MLKRYDYYHYYNNYFALPTDGPGFSSTSPDVSSSTETTAMIVRTRTVSPRLRKEWCREEEERRKNNEKPAGKE